MQQWSLCSASLVMPCQPGTPLGAFFRKALRAKHTVPPQVINVDRNPAYPKAVAKLKKKGTLPHKCELRPIKVALIRFPYYLVEQDHRFIKRIVNPGLGFWSLDTAWR